MFTILIADPYKYMREFLKRELTASGYRVTEAKNHKDLFSQIRVPYPPDLIVMDLDLQHWRSMDHLKKINDMIPSIPVIIYSNRTQYEDHPEVARAEAFIEKDGDFEVLMEAIPNALRKRYARRWEAQSGMDQSQDDQAERP